MSTIHRRINICFPIYLYRHLDEVFLTWNGSEIDLHALFDMPSNKCPSPAHLSIRLNTSIGRTVHFMNTYLSHNNGILHTKVYHYPNTNQNFLPSIPYVPMCFDAKLIRKQLIHAARCCSNINDFNDEVNHMTLSYVSHGFSTTCVQKCVQQFFNEFKMSTMNHLSTARTDDYTRLRLRVIEYEKQKKRQEQQRKLDEENTFVIYCSTDLCASQMAFIQQALDSISKEYSQDDQSEENQIKFKLVPHQSTPLSANDYLVNKRPALRLLTLSESDIDDDDDCK